MESSNDNATNARPLAVITGASSGIGLELAREFARRGFDLFITSGSDRIYQAKKELEGMGVQVRALAADLTRYENIEQLYQAIIMAGRPVDVIALNAGIGVSGDFARKTPLDEELKLIELNVVSVVHLAKRVAHDMALRGEGRMLFTASIAATMPAPFLAVYAASKAFVHSFAEALRNELEDTGVTVTSLLPGPTETNFFRRAHMEDTPVAQAKKDNPADVARDAVKALLAGDDHVVAGSLMNKVQATMAKLLPEVSKAALHRRQTEPQHASH